MIAVGGIAKKSPYVMQTLCDVLKMPIKVVRSEQACALGAAIIASVNAGISASYKDACDRFVRFEELCLDDAEKRAFYENKYKKYSELLSAIKGVVKQW